MMLEHIVLFILIGSMILILFTGIRSTAQAIARSKRRKPPMAVKKGSIVQTVWRASELGYALPMAFDYARYDSPTFDRKKQQAIPAGDEKTAAYAGPRKVLFGGQEFLLNYGENPAQVLARLEHSGATITAR